VLSVAIELGAADVVAQGNDCSSGSRPIDVVVAEARSRSGHDDVRAARIYPLWRSAACASPLKSATFPDDRFGTLTQRWNASFAPPFCHCGLCRCFPKSCHSIISQRWRPKCCP